MKHQLPAIIAAGGGTRRGVGHLDAAAARDVRLADAHHRITAHVLHLRSAVTGREAYGLVHGELGPDHVLVTPAGEAVVIDFEGLTYFDVEWDDTSSRYSASTSRLTGSCFWPTRVCLTEARRRPGD